MEEERVIDVAGLTKVYKIYAQPVDRLKEALHPWRKQYYQPFKAIRDVTFSVQAGEVVGMIGRNGSGKSTLLKMLTGVLTPTTGFMKVAGKVSALLELGAGFNPDMTGRENIFFQGALMGFNQPAMAAKQEDILGFADIGDYIDQPVKTYSSGMFARLAFALAVHVEPDILIVDEALSVGDIRFQQKAMREMQSLMDKAKAIIFVSHDMRSIRSFCSRVIWLSEGRIFRDGDPKTIARLYEDYMIHDILPSDTTIDTLPELSPIAANRSLKLEVDWLPITPTSQLGGENAAFRQIALELPLGAEPQALEGNETITVLARLQVGEKIELPLLGFGLFNDKGMPIVHFNSATANCKLGSLAAGREYCVRLRLQLPNLRDGNYFLSLGLDDGLPGFSSVIHHVSDCYCLKVRRTDHYAGQYGTIILPDATIDVV